MGEENELGEGMTIVTDGADISYRSVGGDDSGIPDVVAIDVDGGVVVGEDKSVLAYVGHGVFLERIRGYGFRQGYQELRILRKAG